MTWAPPPYDDHTVPRAVAWTPTGGGAPVPPEGAADPGHLPYPPPGQVDPYGAPPVPPPSPRRSRTPLVAAVVAGVVVLVGASVAAGLAVRGSDTPSGSGGAPTPLAAAPTTVAPATAAATADATTTAPAPTTPKPSPTTPAVVASLANFSGPGGITVQGPAGWVPDTSAGISSVADYKTPTSPARLLGGSFRIGIGNTNPSGSFAEETQAAAAFLQSQYGAAILRTAPLTYLGADAVDIEYRFTDPTYAVVRHGVERLWRANGVTYIVQASGLDTGWRDTTAVFTVLTRTAAVG